MLNIFLDTNIIIDFIARRENFYEEAATIVSLAINNRIKLHAASMSFATTSYIIGRKFDNNTVKLVIDNFCKICKLDVVDADCVNYGIHSEFADFEDAMQFRCAQKAKADYIITRNTKDFTASSIPVYTPHEFLIEILNL